MDPAKGLPEANKVLRELHAAKDYTGMAEHFFKFFHTHDQEFVNNPAIKQLYDGSTMLTGGASEAKAAIALSIPLLAAEYEFLDQVDGQETPHQARRVAMALFEFIKSKEDERPGMVASAVKFVRDDIEYGKQYFLDHPEHAQ